jgi:UTP--glucose-1-phosphate uridylyltransferase
VVITAAGQGRRMKSINSELPKELLSILNKPAIQYSIDEAIASGMTEITVVLNKEKQILRRYFEDELFRRKLFPNTAFEINQQISKCNISFAYQEKQKGEMDAISCAEKNVGDNTFAIIYPDDIHYPFSTALKGLKAAFMETGIDTIALSEVNRENATVTGNTGRIDYKIFKGNIFKITKFFPKTLGHFNLGLMEKTFRTCGMMISNSHIFEYIEKFRKDVAGKEYIDFHVRNHMLSICGFMGFQLPGKLFDVGNPQGYMYCINNLNQMKN